MKTLLRIDGSPRKEASVSKQLADSLERKLQNANEYTLIKRDVYYDPLIKLGNDDSISAYFTPPEAQSDVQKEAITASNILANEFAKADTYIISTPMYNFGVSAGLKAYIDLIVRAGINFKYTDQGPIGLLENKKAYVIITTGGTPIGASVDHVSTYLTTLLNFIGIKDIQFINSDLVMSDPEQVIAKKKQQIEELSI